MVVHFSSTKIAHTTDEIATASVSEKEIKAKKKKKTKKKHLRIAHSQQLGKTVQEHCSTIGAQICWTCKS